MGTDDALMVLGLIAGTLTSIGPFLQMVKTVRTRETNDLSWGMWIFFCSGIVLWLVYGIARGDIPVIAANLATLMFAAVILGVMIKNRNNRRRTP